MNNSAAIARRESNRSSGLLVVASALMLVTASALAEDLSAVSGGAIGSDLTGLSLQQLYNLDVVQLNVLGGHTHPAGQTMLGYAYMHMNMGDLHQGTKEIPVADVFDKGFGTAHIKMDMDMSMFELMHAPSDSLTLMAMLPYKQMSMLHQEANGNRFTQRASGIGDLEVMALYTFFGDIRKGGVRMVLNAGMAFPTGSINVKDNAKGNPRNAPVQLEYPMQLGSGTFDLMPGLTIMSCCQPGMEFGDSCRWCWGAQTIETIRLGRNDAGYSFGNVYRLSAWVTYGVTDWFAPSARLLGSLWENVEGADPRLSANPTPEGRPNLQGGSRVDLLFGLNFYAPGGKLKGNRLMLEGGFPIYQNLNGPQLGASWMLALGWTYAF